MFQYVRLADNTDIDTVVELLVFHYVQLLVYVSVCSPSQITQTLTLWWSSSCFTMFSYWFMFQYVRLADNTDIDTVVELLLNHWHLDHPHHANLVITVIGGAKNFHLDGKKKDIFNRGLINVCRVYILNIY